MVQTPARGGEPIASKALLAPRLLLELAVIVLGVLLALAADRWNQERSDRSLERAYLERFVDDIRRDSLSAESYLSRFPGIESARDTLLRFVDGGPAPPALNSTVSRAFDQFNLPAASTWNEILGSSSLGLLRAAGVRDVLSSYYGSVRPGLELNLARSDRRGRDPFTDALYPMGLYQPCMPGQSCSPAGRGLDGTPDGSDTYRDLDPEVFRRWPRIRELIVGLGSHHGTQRLFAAMVAESAGRALRDLAEAR